MLLIWGWRSRSKVLARGGFFCPHCGGDRQYAHKQARRWFTLFFIPIIPLKVQGEYVECETCHKKYETRVLQMPTTAGLQTELLAAHREAFAWILRSAATPSSGRAPALAVLSEVAGRPYPDEELDADVSSLDVGGLLPRLSALGATLNEHGKESFVSSCVQVAGTGGVIDGSSRDLLDHIAGALAMTPAHARGVIDLTLERLSQA